MSEKKETIKVIVNGAVRGGESRVARVIQDALHAYGFDVKVSDPDHPLGAPYIEPAVIAKSIAARVNVEIEVVQVNRGPVHLNCENNGTTK